MRERYRGPPDRIRSGGVLADPFAGRTAIVTGAGSGIGRALAEQLAVAGACVVATDVDGDAAMETAGRINDVHVCGVTAEPLDVRDRAAVHACVDRVISERGRVDLLFNNAGISLGGPTHELSGAHWDRVIEVNLGGVVNGVLAVYPQMIRQGSGHIVNTASGAGLVAPPFVTAYAAAKHAVVGLSTGLRAEAARHGVRVTVLCPGAVDTPILDRSVPIDLPATSSPPVTARQYLAAVGQKPISADRFARDALRAVAKNKRIVVVPRRAAALWYLHRLSPALTDRLIDALAARIDRKLLQPRS